VGRIADATAPAPRRSDDAIAFATARNSNNGGTARSVVGVVPPQPFNVYGHSLHGRGHMAVVRLILRLSSSE
jgi:hypothetical protein